MSSTNNTPLELHACMGLNACKGHDRFGTNDCAGMGYCATAQSHNCHTLNNCRGQGGCGLYGTDDEQINAGNNPCAWQGSCAVPINAERIVTTGSNRGDSVWKHARARFEERMKAANRTYGPNPQTVTYTNGNKQTVTVPCPAGPPRDFLGNTPVPGACYTACGASGLSGGGSCA